METNTTVAVCNSVDDPKPDDQTMGLAQLILRIEIKNFFTKNLRTMQAGKKTFVIRRCAHNSKNSMHLRHSRGGIPETNSVEGVPSVTAREITSAATKATLKAARLYLGTALSKVIYFAASLELRKHHASDRTRISSTTTLGIV